MHLEKENKTKQEKHIKNKVYFITLQLRFVRHVGGNFTTVCIPTLREKRMAISTYIHRERQCKLIHLFLKASIKLSAEAVMKYIRPGFSRLIHF